ARVEGRFGRDRVRAFRPFEAVALGAAAYAAGGSLEGDHIVHDYALQLAHATTGEPEYLTVIPRGTPFPTAPAHWRQQLRPTCALGVPETFFKLIICEVGQARDDERLLAWDQRGELRVLRPGDRATVVPLNADHPALGVIDPPHQPNDPTPRLDVALGVNADRWLIATVRDTRTQRVLLREQPLVRLL
ncbi:MAG TPA: hypothetical protein PKA64_02415, partial [Myxococcota bacterium]|nr:hypothetical protein [Myxococcota bacterium]